MKKLLAILVFLTYIGAQELHAEAAYAQLSSVAIQRPAPITGSLLVVDTASPMKNFTLSPNKDALICKLPGLYFVSCSMQPAALSRGIEGYLDCWFELNGSPIAASNTRQYVTQDAPVNLLTVPFLVSLHSGDTIGTRIAASGPNIGVIYIQSPNSNEPSITSYILSIFKVE
jgi:hypothetical protein